MDDRQDFRRESREDWQDFADDYYHDRGHWGHRGGDDLWVGFAAGLLVGAAIASIPKQTTTVVYTGTTYHYYGGAYYQVVPSGGYVVVPAPVGIVVAQPPPNCSVVRLGEVPYCYHYGTFYLYDVGLNSYKVVSAPTGIIVMYLPDGKEEIRVNGAKHYLFAGVHYRPLYVGNDLVYQVVEL